MTNNHPNVALPEEASETQYHTTPPVAGGQVTVSEPTQHTATVHPGGPVAGPLGQVRSTGVCFLLSIVTLGFYALYYNYKVHKEMKVHSGGGIGGGLAILLSFVPFVMSFLTPSEVGALYSRRGQKPRVSGVTGLWVFLPLVGAIVWFVKTNGALNEYWRSMGQRG